MNCRRDALSVFHLYLGGFVAVRQPRFDRGSDTAVSGFCLFMKHALVVLRNMWRHVQLPHRADVILRVVCLVRTHGDAP